MAHQTGDGRHRDAELVDDREVDERQQDGLRVVEGMRDGEQPQTAHRPLALHRAEA